MSRSSPLLSVGHESSFGHVLRIGLGPFVGSAGQWFRGRRVPAGFVCASLFYVLAQPMMATMVIGGLIACAGLVLRAWASGHIQKNVELTMSGPYAYTRNPLYLGSFLLGLGFTLAGGQPFLVGLYFILFACAYVLAMYAEETRLRALFGPAHERYAQETPLFLPRLWPLPTPGTKAFDPNLYLRHREYRAALGFAAAWTALGLKAALTGGKACVLGPSTRGPNYCCLRVFNLNPA